MSRLKLPCFNNLLIFRFSFRCLFRGYRFILLFVISSFSISIWNCWTWLRIILCLTVLTDTGFSSALFLNLNLTCLFMSLFISYDFRLNWNFSRFDLVNDGYRHRNRAVLRFSSCLHLLWLLWLYWYCNIVSNYTIFLYLDYYILIDILI